MNAQLKRPHAPPPVFETITITPELAHELLESAAVNRSMSENAARRFASAMARGQWTLGQPLLFDKAGRLVDGQHRLRAVIYADMAVAFHVLRGIEAAEHIDIGRRRTASDVLGMSGAKNANALASATKAILVSEARTASWPGAAAGNNVTLDDIVARARSDEGIPPAVTRAVGSCRRLAMMMKGSGGTAWFIYTLQQYVDDQEAVDEFFSRVCGHSPPHGDNDPTRVLYSRLAGHPLQARRILPEERLALLCKAWNAFAEGREVSMLRYSKFTEGFPGVVTDRPWIGAEPWNKRAERAGGKIRAGGAGAE